VNTKIYDFNYDEVVTLAGTVAARIVSYDIVFGDGVATLFTTVPAAINSTGVVGKIAFSNNFLYICVATNTWRRVQLGTWD
jgi:hypothetical protein